MSIAQAERLKTDLTDKYVVVQDGVPELQRFTGLTGQIKTVNMNCRALVQFDGPVDITWYDIDPAYLKVVPAPAPKPAGHAAKPAPSAAATPKAAPPKAPAGPSPLELARAQGVGTKSPSPLELARQQGAARDAAPAPVEAQAAPVVEVAAPAPAPAAPSTETPSTSSGKTLERPGSTADILALARKQGAAKHD